MASVDSGVETGNDSNDSSIVQHESQHAVASPVAAAANVAVADIGQVAVGEVASVAVTGTGESNENILPSPSYLMALRTHWPDDMELCSVMNQYHVMNQYKFSDHTETSLMTHDIEQKWHRNQILKRYKGNLPLCKIHCDKTCRRKITEIRLRPPVICGRFSRETYGCFSREDYSEKPIVREMKLRSKWTEWQKSFNERKLRLAAVTNDVERVRDLLNKNVSPNNHDVEGRTPLHHAACRGYAEVVRLLLENGADPNQRDRIGNTPLHLAAVTSKISIVTLLLAAGTDVSSIDQYGFNPLHLAQAKLKMLRNYMYGSATNIKDEMHGIVRMLMAYLNKQKNMNEQIETLNNFCSRLSLSSTSDQVQDDMKDLLANIETLDITS